jgi:hypothetical protein
MLMRGLPPCDQARLKNDTTSDLILTRSAYDQPMIICEYVRSSPRGRVQISGA